MVLAFLRTPLLDNELDFQPYYFDRGSSAFSSNPKRKGARGCGNFPACTSGYDFSGLAPQSGVGRL